MSLDRRRFLGAAGALALMGSAGCGGVPARRRVRQIGLQLYMLGSIPPADMASTLRAVADIGFREVELPGLYGMEPVDFRRELDNAGLACPSLHVPFRSQGAGELSFQETERVAEAARALGAGYAVLPMVPWPQPPSFTSTDDIVEALFRATTDMTFDDWARAADRFNQIGKDLAAHGIRFAYHNHNLEFIPLGGTTPMDFLIEHTDPEFVHFEIDTAWVAAAGINPAEFIRQHSARTRLLHVKDMAPTAANTRLQINPSDVGSGVLDMEDIVAAGLAADVDHFFVEQEPPFKGAPLESAQVAFDYLRPLL